MGWSVDIGDGDFVIDAKAKFDVDCRAVDNENGTTDYLEYWIEIEGDVVESTPSLVADGQVLNLEQVDSEFGARRVQLILDGVTKFDFDPSECIGSPKITRFRTIQDDGGGDSHWRYALSIYIKKGGNDTGGLFELQTSIVEIRDKDVLVRKIWKASAKARSMAAALGAVLAFKPNDPDIREEIERFFQENRVIALWEWDAKDAVKTQFVAIEEDPIVVTGDGEEFIEQLLAGKTTRPELHAARNRMIEIRVRGRVVGSAPGLVPPPPHFSPTDTLKRATAREGKFYETIQIEQDQTGNVRTLFVLPYEEIWLSLKPVTETPNHSDHQPAAGQLSQANPPGDGGISAS